LQNKELFSLTRGSKNIYRIHVALFSLTVLHHVALEAIPIVDSEKQSIERFKYHFMACLGAKEGQWVTRDHSLRKRNFLDSAQPTYTEMCP
jgi:hypothetical protein